MCLIKWMAPHTPQSWCWSASLACVETSVLPPPGGRNWNYHAPYSEESGESLAISLFYPSSAFSLTSGGRKWSLTSFSFTEGNSYISPHWQSSGTFGSLRPAQMFPGTASHHLEERERHPTSILINIILGLVSKQESQVSKTGKTITKGSVLSFSYPFL